MFEWRCINVIIMKHSISRYYKSLLFIIYSFYHHSLCINVVGLYFYLWYLRRYVFKFIGWWVEHYLFCDNQPLWCDSIVSRKSNKLMSMLDYTKNVIVKWSSELSHRISISKTAIINNNNSKQFLTILKNSQAHSYQSYLIISSPTH